VRISGFTIVRNAVRLDFPVVPAIRSILDVCDEVVVNVGRSEDETRDLITGIGDPRIRIVDSEWNLAQGARVLSDETQKALEACRGDWGIYIQADEVLGDGGAGILRDAMLAAAGDPRVEGLVVGYLHFYGGFDVVSTHREWYRREVRAVRIGGGLHSYGDAQGFRVGPLDRRVRARLTDAVMYHYGWARPTQAIQEKFEASKAIFPWSRERSARKQVQGYLDWIPLLRQFDGAHPAVAREWIAARADAVHRIGPRRLKPRHLRLYFSAALERIIGTRLFEYRNYELVS